MLVTLRGQGVKGMRIERSSPTKESRLLTKFSLSVPEEMYREQYGECVY